MKITQTMQRPQGICGIIAAVEGFGKTTLAARLPDAVFIDTDKGTDGMAVPRIEFGGTIGEFKAIIEELRTTKPDKYRTVVIDTADALEQSLTADYCKLKNWANMEHRDYGKDWNEWKPEFARMLDDLKKASKQNGWNIFFTAHVQTKEFADILRGEKYNRVTLKTAPCTAALLKEWADIYMTGLFVTDVLKDKVGLKDVYHAIGGRRMCYFEHNEKFDGKCRACVQLSENKPFPKELTLDEVITLLPQAIEFSTSQDVPDFAAIPTAEPHEPLPFEPVETVEAPEADTRPEHIIKLREAMKAYKIEDEPLRAYLKSKGKWGDNIWPVDEIPEAVAKWILGGVDKIAAKINK